MYAWDRFGKGAGKKLGTSMVFWGEVSGGSKKTKLLFCVTLMSCVCISPKSPCEGSLLIHKLSVLSHSVWHRLFDGIEILTSASAQHCSFDDQKAESRKQHPDFYIVCGHKLQSSSRCDSISCTCLYYMSVGQLLTLRFLPPLLEPGGQCRL